MSVVSIRGAITVNENSVLDILQSTKELLAEINNSNIIDKEKVISILFSCTNDLNKAYPAKAARDLGYTQCSLMCFHEMEVENSLRKCIRVMILYESDIEQKNVNHIYLKGAKILRPDLTK
jgi:chorismate mutase